jgi:carboxypeptidase C (cathepsin A)
LYGHGLISKSDMNQIQQQYAQCAQDIEAGDYSDAFNDCGEVLGMGLQAAGNINVYDIRKQCTNPPLCYDFDNIVNYLSQPSVINKLGVSGVSWSTCNSDVYQYLVNDFEFSYRFDIPKLLANGVRVLVYNGKSYIFKYILCIYLIFEP